MLEPAALILSLLNSSSSSSSSSAEDFLPTSLRSGCGLALVGSVCSRQPPDDSSSRSLEFLHFIRRFWNQIFTCGQEKKRSVSEKRGSQRGVRAQMTHGACFKHMFKFFCLFCLFVCFYLWVLEAQFGGQFLPVGLADVFLLLEHFLQGFALHVGEHRPPQHPSAGFPSGGQGPRKRPGDGNDWRRCWNNKTNRRQPVRFLFCDTSQNAYRQRGNHYDDTMTNVSLC